MQDYGAEMEAVKSHGLAFHGGVFVEALSDDPVKETEWVASLNSPFIKGIVSYAYLADEQVEQVLKAHSRFTQVKGIRQILNHHPTDSSLVWPKVHSANYFAEAAFGHGFSLLQKYNLSFDLHANPHQLKTAAAFLKDYPSTPVVLDHLGTLHLPTLSSSSPQPHQTHLLLQEWEEGMKALSQLPQVHVKLSMLGWVYPLWFEKDEQHQEAVQQVRDCMMQVVRMFGPERCMFASNMPVDRVIFGEEGKERKSKEDELSAEVMYGRFKEWVEEEMRMEKLAPEAMHQLFHRTAETFYRL
ncbi:putative metal-dependent hydrolase, TIM-barrel fold [Balamuthia mandrillaris]